MTIERPARLKVPSPDARVARSPFRSRRGTGVDFWDTPLRQARTGFTVNPLPLNGETFTADVGGPNEKTWTYQTVLTDVDGNIQIAATRELTHDNVMAAINLDPAGAGTQYAASMTAQGDIFSVPNPSGSMITQLIVAIERGLVPNDIALADTTQTGWGSTSLNQGTVGVVAFVPIVQWCGIRLRARVTGATISYLTAQFCRPARQKAPLGEPLIVVDPNADETAYIYTIDQPSIEETFLGDGTEVSLEIACGITNGGPEHIGENWLKLTVSTDEPDNAVLDFCDISGELLDLHY